MAKSYSFANPGLGSALETMFQSLDQGQKEALLRHDKSVAAAEDARRWEADNSFRERQQGYVERQGEPIRLKNVMEAAQSGAYPTYEGLAQAGGQWLPQVTAPFGLSSFPTPTMPNKPPAQGENGLMSVPPSYGKPTSFMDMGSDRSPAGQTKRSKTSKEEKRDNIGSDVITAELTKIQNELANIDKSVPLTPEDQLARIGYSYESLAKMYPDMVDVQNRRLHPFLQNELSKLQVQDEKRKNALLARKDQLMQAIALAGIKSSTQPTFIQERVSGSREGQTFEQKMKLLEANSRYKSAQRTLSDIQEARTDFKKKMAILDGAKWPDGRPVKEREQSQYLDSLEKNAYDKIDQVQAEVMGSDGQAKAAPVSAQSLADKSKSTPRQPDEKKGAPRKVRNGKILYETVTGELKELK